MLESIEKDISKCKNEELLLKGLLDGRLAFCGPDIVQFDITNRCNNNCVCCWSNSPLLGKLSCRERKKRQQELPIELVKKVIEELHESGTRTLIFAGGGEPFMHPDIMNILRYAKHYNMRIYMNTNFTLLDEEKIYDLVDLKIDHIHVSLLAGTAKTYAIIHHNKTEEDFYRIKKTLIFLARVKDIKKAWGPLPYPHINAYYVIFNKNYHEIKPMVDLALEIRANSIEFSPFDVIHGKTDSLLLNKEQAEIAKNKIKEQLERLKELKNKTESHAPFVEQANLILNRLSSKNVDMGEYETNVVQQRPCYVGWAFARIMADGNVIPCLKAHRMPVGNIHRHSFKRIWNSRKQQIFRIKSFNLNHNNNYFKKIGNTPGKSGCQKSCDNIVLNIEIHERFKNKLNFNIV